MLIHIGNLKQRNNKIGSLDVQIKDLQATKDRLEREREEALSGREESAERNKKLSQLAKLEERNSQLREEAREYAALDPELIDDMSK